MKDDSELTRALLMLLDDESEEDNSSGASEYLQYLAKKDKV